jgi:elongation factor G
MWPQAALQSRREAQKPILFFINKMDKPSRFERAWNRSKQFDEHAHPPSSIGSGRIQGCSIIDSRAFAIRRKASEEKIPAEEETRFNEWQKKLIEEVAETDESLFEKLASGEDLKKDDILPRLIQDIEEEEIIPVLVGSSVPPKGLTLILDTLTHLILPPSKLPDLKGKNPQNGEEEIRKGLPVESAATQVFKVVSDPGVGDIFFLKIFSGTVYHGEDLVNPRSKEQERMGHLFLFSGKERVEVKEAFAGDVVGAAKLKNTEAGDTLCDRNRPIAIDPIGFPAPVLSMAVKPKTRQDQEKMGFAMGKLTAYDPTFHYHIDHEFAETIVSGMGEVQIEVIVERLRSKQGIDISLGTPHVPYRETITKVQVQGNAKAVRRPRAGAATCGSAWSQRRSTQVSVADEIGGAVLRVYSLSGAGGEVRCLRIWPDIRRRSQGRPLRRQLPRWILRPGFQIAGSMTLKKAEEEARPILLEPILSIEVLIPADFVGAITNDLTTRRGKILGMDQDGDLHVIRGEVPMAEVFKYATDLRSLTHGAGRHKMEFARYEPVPANLMDKVVKENSRLEKTDR